MYVLYSMVSLNWREITANKTFVCLKAGKDNFMRVCNIIEWCFEEILHVYQKIWLNYQEISLYWVLFVYAELCKYVKVIIFLAAVTQLYQNWKQWQMLPLNLFPLPQLFLCVCFPIILLWQDAFSRSLRSEFCMRNSLCLETDFSKYLEAFQIARP